jgi:hypothetical protein
VALASSLLGWLVTVVVCACCLLGFMFFARRRAARVDFHALRRDLGAFARSQLLQLLAFRRVPGAARRLCTVLEAWIGAPLLFC